MADPPAEASTEETLGSGELANGSPQSLEQKQNQPVQRQRAKIQSESFAIYFPRVLKNVQVGLSLSQEALSVLDSFVKDMFERIAQEAGHLTRSTGRTTITSREIQTAVRLLLPGEIGKHAMSEATKALIRYIHRQ
ncbi:Histone H2B type W-T [Galemys pyrenaicus]|uniref:Histone H2B type W-T n=1 Tax=Galemys pyrenaicus TaxID=202257 RepID=A0A8J5ZWR5_GALPY|nr:Histone H2B type W-T [Galemys pyrenaicus]